MLPFLPPSHPQPRFLFLDMNAFYTSVEQQECPDYRGRPTVVVPMLADTTCVLAASYEAKALGIHTGTSVRLARIACPQLQVVEARPQLYLEYHARLRCLLNDHFATIRVLSVDEMACRIPDSLFKTCEDERRLAYRLKVQMARDLGPALTCSIGIGPNVFLAKVAAERHKPDGLTLFHEDNLPESLFSLKLGDLPGIGSAMRRRLTLGGIGTVEALWNASPQQLRRVWGSVVGARWYYMLRGSHECDYQPMQAGAVRKSVGHSNVLAPAHRTREGAQRIVLELFAKALQRLRAYDQAASAVQIRVQYRKLRGLNGSALPFVSTEGVWTRRSRKHLHANDEATWLKVVRPMVEAIPDLSPLAEPSQVSVVMSELLACQDVNLSLFDEDEARRRLGQIVADLNQKYGPTLTLAGLPMGDKQVPQRIPFGPPEPPIPLLQPA